MAPLTTYDPDLLLPALARASVVLIGEASHGTHEFYSARADLTRRLIQEHDFAAVAIEGDWPDAQRVNRFVRGAGPDTTVAQALAGFTRFPQWMWRNHDVRDFVGDLRRWNDRRAAADRVGIYGLDLYSLHRSIEAVLEYLDGADPESARRARARYACFDHAGADPQSYGYATRIGARPSCEREAIAQLVDLERSALQRDTPEFFSAEQNARLVADAERYYRTMFDSHTQSWNVRDRHMVDTLSAILDHLGRRSPARAKVVVWAHNSHVGDARATERAELGEVNLGQLARERFGKDAYLVGFSTWTGTVAAADDWGAPMEIMAVRPALAGSWEEWFHQQEVPRLLAFPPRDGERYREQRLQRAIGVVYRPATERLSHYYHTRLADQFDAMIHFDRTTALSPLDWRASNGGDNEPPEIFPTAL